MPETLDVLFIDGSSEGEEDAPARPGLEAEAEKTGVRLVSARSAEEGLRLLARYGGLIDAVLLRAGSGDHRQGLQRIQALYPTLPLLMLHSAPGEDGAKSEPRPQLILAALRQAVTANGEKPAAPCSSSPSTPFILAETGEAPDSGWDAYFAFRLSRMARPRSEAEETDAVQAALGWHRRLLATLTCCGRAAAPAGADVRFHVRYVSASRPRHSPPSRPHPARARTEEAPIEIALVAVVEAAEEKVAREQAAALLGELQVLLGPHPRSGAGVYHFAPARTETQLRRLLIPFRPHVAAYLAPRTRAVPLPTALLALEGLAPAGDLASAPVELPLPFTREGTASSLHALCDLLTQRPAPLLIDCALRPAPLTSAERSRLRALAHLASLRDAEHALSALYGSHCSPGEERALAARAETLLRAGAGCAKIRIYLAQARAAASSPGLQAAALESFFGGAGGAEAHPAYAETRRGMLRLRAPAATARGDLASRYAPHEAAQLFRLPLPLQGEMPGVPATHPAYEFTPEGLPAEGPVLGVRKPGAGRKTDAHDRLVRLAPEDLRRHVHVLGQTGTGKTTMLCSMLRERMEAGAGVGLIDPHGDLWEHALDAVPKARRDDVVLFDPADPRSRARLNLLEYDPERPQEKAVLIEELFGIFREDVREDWMGPMFQMYMRNACLLAMESEEARGTLLDVVKIFQDEGYRRRLLKAGASRLVSDFWTKEAGDVGGEVSIENIAPYVTSKLGAFVYNDTLRRLIDAPVSTMDFRQVLDEGKILLAKLPKGELGAFGTRLLGTVLVARLLMAALSREDIPEEERRDFTLFVDEFQTFTSAHTASMLSEARKYRLGLVLANQTLGQLEGEIRSALGNAGSRIFFRPGPEDYAAAKPYLAPPFEREEILRLPNFTAIARLMIENEPAEPFLLETCPPEPGGTADHIAPALL